MGRIFSVSTHWNAARHTDGEAMIDEIVALTGLRHVELGYDLTADLVPGVRKAVAAKTVGVTSLHNFCPVPIGAHRGHPELFVMTSFDSRVRENAILHTRRTVEFAAEIGARSVVMHGGNVEMKALSVELIEIAAEGGAYNPKYEKIKTRLLLERDRRIGPHLDHLKRGLEELLPALEQYKVTLCLENLPTWESIPSETEMEELLKAFNSPWLGAWYDIGHGQIRQNLGFVAHRQWFQRLRPLIRGMHVHDVLPPARDHVMPPKGQIDFKDFSPLIPDGIPLVIEPSAGTLPEDLKTGSALLIAQLSG